MKNPKCMIQALTPLGSIAPLVKRENYLLELEIGFNMYIQSTLFQHMFVVGATFDLGQPFCPRQIGFTQFE